NTLELLCPISQSRIKNREYEEMLLRFFAYRFDMDSYKKEVHLFLTDFMAKMNGEYKYKNDETHISFDKVLFTQTFDDMLKFIKNNFGPLYFKRTETQKSVPRIRFEALAVGVSLALETTKTLDTTNISNWLESNDFTILTASDA